MTRTPLMLMACALLLVPLTSSSARADYSCRGDCRVEVTTTDYCDPGYHSGSCDEFCDQCIRDGSHCFVAGGYLKACSLVRHEEAEVTSRDSNKEVALRKVRRACDDYCRGLIGQQCHASLYSLTGVSCY
jgi:hypothetical protein